MYEELKEILNNGKRMVFFGGAGVSTESGIPDFRSETGLYNAKQEFGRAPEEMLSHHFFLEDTETFFKYYKKNLIATWAKPNKAHIALAKLEEQGLTYEVVGEGQFVSMQTPLTGSEVIVGSTVMLYTGGSTLPPVTVPNVVGLPMSEANARFAEAGLNYIAKGASANRDDVKVLRQSIAPGTPVDKWSVITVDLGVKDQTG